MAAVAESDNEEDSIIRTTKTKTVIYTSQTMHLPKVDSSFLMYPHLTKTADSAVMTRTVFNQDNQCKFLVDSGASRHICSNVRMFTHIYDSPPRRIIVGNGESIECWKIGTIELYDRIKLLNVLYVPTFGANVITLSMLDKYNLSAYFFDGHVKIGSENDLEVFVLRKKNMPGLYDVSCSADRMADPIYHPQRGESFALTAAAQKKLWHERMGYANHKVVA
jgi:hypothetical protein